MFTPAALRTVVRPTSICTAGEATTKAALIAGFLSPASHIPPTGRQRVTAASDVFQKPFSEYQRQTSGLTTKAPVDTLEFLNHLDGPSNVIDTLKAQYSRFQPPPPPAPSSNTTIPSNAVAESRIQAADSPQLLEADATTNPEVFAISVKRQRKLKMKKHKYKKLMKRTRLLRRKLDRL
ncbi:hypothetical protein M011DRAFT_478201 [Sporormia fimetaria CBS 119925]|uniref:Small ribosomal subunit protein mS38 n=1 Tax=Sporormia fimetaria CBS 119925 TaxID=1340428 RepID=A0A6A6V7Z7_9PLEO|nr:hypothetical protein M011DRAFT_478201 [Sporormia fimetaria CBS 119925]